MSFESITKFASDHPVVSAVYVGGAVLSVLAHSCIKASKSHAEWKKKEMKNIEEENRTEAAVSVVMQGGALGFFRGLLTCTIWPVELTAVTYVLVSNDSRKVHGKKD